MTAERGTAAPANRILKLLPAGERRAVAAESRVEHVEPGQVLCEPGVAPRQVYFPRRGLIALFAGVAEGARVGVGLLRADGVFGTGGTARSNLFAVSQGAGQGDSIDAGAFEGLLQRCPGLRSALFRHLHEIAFQLAQNIACLALHSSRQRLARWMIDATFDDADDPGFVSTQAAIAVMLGLQRPAVSHLAAELQRGGLIRYSRGRVTVLDRAALRAVACGCSRVPSTGR